MLDGFQLIRKGVTDTLDCCCELPYGLYTPARGFDCRHLDCMVLELPRVCQTHCSLFHQHVDDSLIREGRGEVMPIRGVVIPCATTSQFEMHELDMYLAKMIV